MKPVNGKNRPHPQRTQDAARECARRKLRFPWIHYRTLPWNRRPVVHRNQASKKAVRKLMREIHEQTTKQWYASEPRIRTTVINQKLRGWAGYFDQRPVVKEYRTIRNYTERRLRRWLMRRSKQRDTGYRQYPDAYLYEKLGLFMLPCSRADQSNAKTSKSEMRAGCGKSASPVRRAGIGNGTPDEQPLRLWS